MDKNGQYKTEVLTLAEVATFLKLSEKTVHRMIAKQEIPCSKVGGQWRFVKSLLDEWLLAGMQPGPATALGHLLVQEGELVPLSRLFQPELINLDIKAGSKRDLLFQLVEPLLKTGRLVEAEPFVSMLLARESMASTAIDGGVAMPHLRRPGDNPLPGPRVIAGVAPGGVDFAAFDGKPTHLFFLIIADSEVGHLKLMARLTTLLREQETRDSLRKAGSGEDFISRIIRREGCMKR